MEIEIKKENFTVDNFDSKSFLNSVLKYNTDSESEIINFKLKIIQREFLNEIDLNINNLFKFTKIMENDIKDTDCSNNNLFKNISEITKNKIGVNQLEELEKGFKIRKKNKNLQIALQNIENKI